MMHAPATDTAAAPFSDNGCVVRGSGLECTPLEGVATLGAFFVLVALAYLLDIGFFSAAIRACEKGQ